MTGRTTKSALPERTRPVSSVLGVGTPSLASRFGNTPRETPGSLRPSGWRVTTPRLFLISRRSRCSELPSHPDFTKQLIDRRWDGSRVPLAMERPNLFAKRGKPVCLTCLDRNCRIRPGEPDTLGEESVESAVTAVVDESPDGCAEFPHPWRTRFVGKSPFSHLVVRNPLCLQRLVPSPSR